MEKNNAEVALTQSLLENSMKTLVMLIFGFVILSTLLSVFEKDQSWEFGKKSQLHQFQHEIPEVQSLWKNLKRN